MIYSVIMVGGSGTRLWPVSRAASPKQMMRVAGDESLLGGTMRRARALSGGNVLLVATSQLADPIRRELPDLAPECLIVEPEGRDTAACVGLAAAHVASRDPDGVMVIMPADHVVEPMAGFLAATQTAARVAADERCLVSIGVVPRWPSTAYGYVQRAERLGGSYPCPAYRVARFREKPNSETAESYVQSGEFYWNSGIFSWRADVILAEIERHLPEHHARLKEIRESFGADDAEAVLARAYSRMPRISVDYGILEKAERVAVVESDFDWDDVGSWTALAAHLPADAQGNAVKGSFLGLDACNCVVVGSKDKLVVGIGLDGLVVVDTPDVLLLVPRCRDQDVKKVVGMLKEQGRTDCL